MDRRTCNYRSGAVESCPVLKGSVFVLQFHSASTEIITCTIPDEEQICPRCGSQIKVVGKKYIREEVELIPAKLVVKKYYSNTYSCKKCEKKNMPVFLHGLVPSPVLPHSLASASTVAWVIGTRI